MKYVDESLKNKKVSIVEMFEIIDKLDLSFEEKDKLKSRVASGDYLALKNYVSKDILDSHSDIKFNGFGKK